MSDFKPKMHQIRFRLGSAPDPAGRAYSAPPDLLAGFKGPRSTQPSIPPGSVNEYQLRLGRQRQVWLIPIADERVGVQVKL